MILNDRPVPLPLLRNGATTGTFLAAGMWQGTWQIRDKTLRVRPFIKLSGAARDALLTEAARLCEFIAEQSACDIVLRAP
ncbi:hypothetical protein [Actinomadura rudentiformis]|uniref:hypothetical protein n=1 Tax=Actinomadura rudentiformis TaxID=359158 RepID=UPI001CEFAF79|nr:hypothetical protein [Actinomadura rudentiformis]